MGWPATCRTLLLTFGLLPLALPAVADDRFQFSGFASFFISKSLERDELYGDSETVLPYKTEYRDYNKLGLRITVDLYDKLKFTTQMLAHGRDDFDPEFDWIFLSYQLDPNLVLHVGKYVTNYYMYSDHADIGYAYHWANAPDVIYGTNINKTLDGAKLVWNSRLASGWTSEFSFMLGQDETSVSRAGLETTMYMDNAFGMSWQLDHDWLGLRIGYMNSKTSADLTNTDLADIINLAALLNDQRLNDALAWNDDKAEFVGLGASLNFDKWFAVVETSCAIIRDALPLGDQHASYISVGTYLPYNTTLAFTVYQKIKHANNDILEIYYDAVDAFGYDPAILDPSLNGLTTGDLIRATQKIKREGITITVRWDFHSNAAFKAEYSIEQNKSYTPLAAETTPQAVQIGIDLVF